MIAILPVLNLLRILWKLADITFCKLCVKNFHSVCCLYENIMLITKPIGKQGAVPNLALKILHWATQPNILEDHFALSGADPHRTPNI